MNMLRRHFVLVISLILLWSLILGLSFLAVQKTQGKFIYTLDDPYIHLAIAKNFSQHGIWGINSEFASLSSSMLYTLLLSFFFFIFGTREIIPFIINVISATGLVFVVYLLLLRYEVKKIYIAVIMLMVILFTPLPPLVFTGMEPLLHTLATVLFIFFFLPPILIDNHHHEKRSFSKMAIFVVLGMCMTMLRYESLFIIALVSIVLLFHKRIYPALLLGGASLIPLIVYGIISKSHGWFFLPNSVLLKGNKPDFHYFFGIVRFMGYDFYKRINDNPFLLVLIVAVILLFLIYYRKQGSTNRYLRSVMLIYIFAFILHVQFADIGWFFRYEAYLIVSGLLIIGIASSFYLNREKFELKKDFLLKYVALILLVGISSFPFLHRTFQAFRITPKAVKNIYEQQYQMGLFLKEHYDGETIAANDIGAIAFLSDVRCIDLWGLANIEAARMQMDGNYKTKQIAHLARKNHVKVAIIYDSWFEKWRGGVPSEWIKVGEWQILENVVCGSDVISFYAVDPTERDLLINKLKRYSVKLPRDVIQSGLYLN